MLQNCTVLTALISSRQKALSVLWTQNVLMYNLEEKKTSVEKCAYCGDEYKFSVVEFKLVTVQVFLSMNVQQFKPEF